ncbi:MAG: hypothetical protein GY701_03850 [Sulfitobacter sp.]|nr:hypothetical protein [Sulfitobacter sp.]
MAELNELMLAGAITDDDRFIAHRRITVGEHFEGKGQRSVTSDTAPGPK